MSGAEIGTYAAGALLILGAFFCMVGAVGMIKLDGPMKRLHAPTKVGTMGIGALLLASIVMAFARGGTSFHELLIMAFLFVTAPISANLISKVHIHLRSCRTPSEAPDGETWSTLVQRGEDGPAAD